MAINTLVVDVELDVNDQTFDVELDTPVIVQKYSGEPYEGSYIVHPASTNQTLDTDGKTLEDDVTIKAVIISGLAANKILEGTTVKIGDADDDDRIANVVGTAHEGITPTGTKSILLTEAGTKTEDVADYAYAEVNAVKSATASGAVASFSDGAEDVPMDSCVVNIEPVQNLNGQSNPYPPGGGKNLLAINATSKTTMGLTIVANSNGSITVNGTVTGGNVSFTHQTGAVAPQKFDAGSTITLSGLSGYTTNQAYLQLIYIGEDESTISIVNANATATYTFTQNATLRGIYLSFREGTTFTNKTIYPQLEYGSTATSYAPYSNICPISGWSEVKVYVTGVNVWDEQWEVGILYSSGEVGAGNRVVSKNFIPIIPNEKYCYSKSDTNDGRCAFYDANKNLIVYYVDFAYDRKYTVDGRSVLEFTTPQNACFMKFCTSTTYGTTYNNDISISYPSTDTAYHASVGITEYPVSLGQTVYGGTLDVVSGVLTVNRVLLTATSCSSTSTASTGIKYAIVPITQPGKAESSSNRCISSIYKLTTSAPSTSGWFRQQPSQFYVFDNRFTDKATADSILASEKPQFVYELATPTIVQLTPTEVKTLLGSNSVWADSGDIAVGYKADVYLTEGGVTPTGTKQINIAQNGTTTEDVTNYASASITTNVPASAVDTGTKNISTNGTHDVVGYANASVNVPNSYSQSDEGKVVSNGALVAQTSDTVTQNGTVDTTLINSLTVNVSGGGGGVITLLNTVEVTEQVRAVNVDISDYSSLYDFIFIYIDAELTASDWLYYVMDGSSPSGGTYQNSMQNHKGICFIQIHPAPGNPATTVLGGVIGGNTFTIGSRNGIPVSNVYVYTYTSTKYFKVGSKFSIYGGNYADM